jgi:hypothetical protein
MAKYRVIIVESENNIDLDQTVKAFVQSVNAKKGTARVAYEGDSEKIINTVDRMLDMERLSHSNKK